MSQEKNVITIYGDGCQLDLLLSLHNKYKYQFIMLYSENQYINNNSI